MVADVGGTNSRFGLSRNGELMAGSIESFRNNDFPSFDSAMTRYLSHREDTRISDAVVAVAGPVHAGKARLTNRDWHFEEAQLSHRIGGHPSALLNDLSALGQASGFLQPESLDPVFLPAQAEGEGGQALVIGVGTGFNVSPVMITNRRVANLNVEYGHISLPVDIAAMIGERYGDAAPDFATIEQVFSGRGYAALSELDMAHFARKEGQNPKALPQFEQDFEAFYAAILAILTRNLMLAFLPRRGIFFAGGVARNLLMSPAKTTFAEIVQRPFALNTVRMAPVHTILDDAAALKGCALYSNQSVSG
ncbi:glucokinase [Aliiroseovarius crassostreae]|uniref:glucokinase n=1 Tax=Aliiroseovarius crassostreae TaxID=154981 RepID=UPI003C7E4A84